MSNEREDRLDRLLGTLREEHRASPELRSRIMDQVRRIPEPVWKRALDWLVRPRTVRLSPATAGLALAAAVAAVTLWPAGGPSEGPAIAPEAAARGEDTDGVPTRFVFVAPGASSVRMTGDFVSWDPEGVALSDPRGTGLWIAEVELPPGVYQYTFIVEGPDGMEWRPDPLAVSQVDDGFGQENSVVIVSGQGEA